MADDFIVLGSDGVTTHTMKAKDLGTKKVPGNVLYDEVGADILGLVTASPAANTIGARLKAIADVEGVTTGAAVVTDANGTIQQYLRGLVKRWVDALGAGTAAAALRVTSASDDPAVTGIGALTETAPATDTASSGLNGRLQRIAQRLTTAIAGIGAVADAAWNGSGDASTISLLKTIATGALDSSPVAISNTVIDGVAHDAADTGNPVKVGAKAAAGLSGATLVAAADRINLVGGLDGAMYVRNVPLEDIIRGNVSNTDGAITEVIATGGAGMKQYLTHVSLTNAHASSRPIVDLKSGTTVMWTVEVPPGGRELNFDPPLPPNAANESWSFDSQSAVTTLYCAMLGFKSKV